MNKIEKIGKILKDARDRKGYSLQMVSTKLEFSGIKLDKSNIMRYEDGVVKNINAEILKELCNIYHLDVYEIFRELNYLDEPPKKSLAGGKYLFELPLYESVSAGDGKIANFVEIGRFSAKLNPNKEYRMVRVIGDSMLGVCDEGDIAVFEVTSVAERKNIVVATIDEFTFIKRYIPGQFGGITLMSDNHFYDPISVPLEDGRFRIDGIVKLIIKNYGHEFKENILMIKWHTPKISSHFRVAICIYYITTLLYLQIKKHSFLSAF